MQAGESASVVLRLFDAISKKDPTLLINTIKGNIIHVDDHHPHKLPGATALHAATRDGWTQGVKLLLGMGSCAMNVKDHHGYTPLHTACESGFTTIASDLIQDRRTDPNPVCTYHQQTPLIKAAKKGYHQIIQLILNVDASGINFVDVKGNTALHYIVRHCFYHSMAILTAFPSLKVDIKNNRLQTTLHVAARFKNTIALPVLMHIGMHSKGFIEAEDVFNLTAFNYAVNSGVKLSISILSIVQIPQ